MSRRYLRGFAFFFFGSFVLAVAAALQAQTLPLVRGVELQPLSAQVERIVQALELAGSPLDQAKREALQAAAAGPNAAIAAEKIQQIMDPLCLAGVQINPESRVKVQAGPAAKELNDVPALAGDGSVPDIRGGIERNAIVAGHAPDGGAGMATLFRIDIFTGKVWMLQAVPMPDRSGTFPVWIPTQELDGDLYREAARTYEGTKWGKRPFEAK